MSLDILRELVILLAASIVIIYISHKIKLPPVVGFLLTRVLIGPGGFSLVRDTRTIDDLAVIAVVRGEESFISPGAGFAVVAGDTLVLVASHRDMNKAFQFLGKNPGQKPTAGS